MRRVSKAKKEAAVTKPQLEVARLRRVWEGVGRAPLLVLLPVAPVGLELLLHSTVRDLKLSPAHEFPNQIC